MSNLRHLKHFKDNFKLHFLMLKGGKRKEEEEKRQRLYSTLTEQFHILI